MPKTLKTILIIAVIASAPPVAAATCVTRLASANGRCLTTSETPRRGDVAWTTCGSTVSSHVRAASSATDDAPLVGAAPVRVRGELREGERFVVLVSNDQAKDNLPYLVPICGNATDTLIPPGSAIGLVMNERNDVVAFSPPLSVRHSDSPALISVMRPAESGLATILETPDVSDIAITLTPSAANPFVVKTKERAFAFFDAKAGAAELKAETSGHILPAQTLDLRRGTVTTVRAALQKKPALDVLLRLDDTREAEAFARGVVMITGADGKQLGGVEVRPNEPVRVENLPEGIVQAVLSVAGMRFQRRVTLAPDFVGDATFTLAPLLVSGRVTRGGDPVDATVHFIRDGIAPVDTTEDGRYEVTLWEAGRAIVHIRAKGADPDGSVAPYSELVDVRSSSIIDFDLPDASARVRVTDRKSGKAIPGAKVGFLSKWRDSDGKERRAGQSAVTQDSGEVQSPPLREGTVEVTATAEGYESIAPVVQEVGKDSKLTIPITLEPTGGGRKIIVRLPGGGPAAGAQAAIARSDDSIVATFTADAEGVFEVPVDSGVILIVRHPAAGGRVTLLPPIDEMRLHLPPAAPPLVIRGIDSERMLVKHGAVYLVVNAIRLGGQSLAFLTESPSLLRSDGTWEGRNLPPVPVHVLLTQKSSAEISTGRFDLFAAAVPFPWSGVVNVTVVQ